LRGTQQNARAARRIIRELRPSLVVSTGSAIAVSYLPAARLAGIPAAYIESAARADGPSLTGRLLRHVPGVQLYSQYPDWARPPWGYAGSVFDEYAPAGASDPEPIKRVVVTVGTLAFCFRRLIERVLEILPADCEVVWQVGASDIRGLGIKAHRIMLADTLRAEISRADLVIAHAGIGSALTAMDAGHCPLLVPRERIHREHVDDHQLQIAQRLDRAGLAIHRTVDQLRPEDLAHAAGLGILGGCAAPALNIAAGLPASRNEHAVSAVADYVG
jgi:UDP-N-acetylglucosamine transferase subunit ALG13